VQFISLFAGIGGMDLGLERAGMTCVAQVEIDEYATRVLAKHWPNVPRFRDVRDVGRHNLPACGPHLRRLSRVRTSATPGSGQASTVSGRDSGASTRESFASYDPATSSWRTSQLCLDGDSMLYSETWPRAGTMRNGVADGIPRRMDRLRGLGNAVVPQVAEYIGRQIMQYSTKKP
jgi:site-specific DNA-cytosine methylase